jgi:carbamoyltransferase
VSVVLGYSGLDGAARFLESRADLSAAEKRIFQGMDAAAAVVIDGRVVAAVQEERFSGQKCDHRFPIDSIRWCLQSAGLDEPDIDVVAHGFSHGPYQRFLTTDPRSAARYHQVLAPECQQQLLAEHLPGLAARLTVQAVRHHKAHALSAAVAAGFADCLTIVMDGMGEIDAISVFRWTDGVLRRLASLDARSSLGLFYSLITLHLGYKPNEDEYRVMALAAFGDPSRYADVLAAAVTLQPGGRLVVPLLRSEENDPYREQYRAGREWLAARTFAPVGPGARPEQSYADLASAAQARLESAVAHVVGHWMEVTGLHNVALAGGVALNCVANGKLFDVGVKHLYVQPAAGDEGTAVGAALAHSGPAVATAFPAVPLLGPSLDNPARHIAMSTFRGIEEAAAAAAQLLDEGAIVGWARGRLEFGPRALGARSILADPRRSDTRDRVNAVVKFREPFRPFAPAVIAEHAADWFELPFGTDLRCMTVAVRVRTDKRAAIPAVTHVDGTARVQVVERETHPDFWAVLNAFAARTGVPVLLNTSLNVVGQPIARTAVDAISTFDRSALDVLFLGDQATARGVWTDHVASLAAS